MAVANVLSLGIDYLIFDRVNVSDSCCTSPMQHRGIISRWPLRVSYRGSCLCIGGDVVSVSRAVKGPC